MFNSLLQEFQMQIDVGKFNDMVEIVFLEDNKEMSIGAKRQKLLEMATGDWIVFFDSDDLPMAYYIRVIIDSIINNPGIDCIGINVHMTTNGKMPQRCCHRLMYPKWASKVHGWDYVRNITHFNPVLRELALQTGFKNLRFGEDQDYSDRLYPLLKKEHYIAAPLFHYRYSNKQNHTEKYGK